MVYSNNFLYKTNPTTTKRVAVKKTAGSTWLEMSLEEVMEEHQTFCKEEDCFRETQLLGDEIKKWREMACQVCINTFLELSYGQSP